MIVLLSRTVASQHDWCRHKSVARRDPRRTVEGGIATGRFGSRWEDGAGFRRRVRSVDFGLEYDNIVLWIQRVFRSGCFTLDSGRLFVIRTQSVWKLQRSNRISKIKSTAITSRNNCLVDLIYQFTVFDLTMVTVYSAGHNNMWYMCLDFYGCVFLASPVRVVLSLKSMCRGKGFIRTI